MPGASMPTRPSRQLFTFPNPNARRAYVIRHVCPEYTALCPVTGQPDFGSIEVVYSPGPRCIELKSLKLYIWAFRDEGHFFEQVTNRILDDLVRACRPRWMTVIGRFNVRGGIGTTVIARHPAGAGPRPDEGLAEPGAARRRRPAARPTRKPRRA